MKKTILLIISLSIMSCKTPKGIDEINKIYVYNFFDKKGYSTAGAYTQFNDMLNNKIIKIEISPKDCEQFNQILKKIKPRHHFQTKFGGNLIFVEALVNLKIMRIIIPSDNLIVDLTNNCNYNVEILQDKQWLNEFIDKTSSSKYE